MLRLIALLLLLVSIFSCRKDSKCHCPIAFQKGVDYVPGDIVQYQEVCFISIGYGRSITPNIKFKNEKNDIWLVCE